MEKGWYSVCRYKRSTTWDFPNVEHFKEILAAYNIDKFKKLKPKMLQAIDDMLGYDLPIAIPQSLWCLTSLYFGMG